MAEMRPDRVGTYFRQGAGALAIVCVSGIIYNAGLAAGPYLEGLMVQCLLDIAQGTAGVQNMLVLAAIYVAAIVLVQGMRAVKRFYVRRFANTTARSMRTTLYNNIVHTPRVQLVDASAGALMTKATSDVDAAVEGMRKVTTEVFDTGVAMVAYFALLASLDLRLAILSCLFTPPAYWLAGRLKGRIYEANQRAKASAGRLSDATIDQVENALLYRHYGLAGQRRQAFETHLDDYEAAATRAGIWESVMMPVYQAVSMAGVVLIVWLGAKNVAGTGWTSWDIASFTAFLSCFARFATKASHCAKLFNAVHKAQASWARIKPLLKPRVEWSEKSELDFKAPKGLVLRDAGMRYGDLGAGSDGKADAGADKSEGGAGEAHDNGGAHGLGTGKIAGQRAHAAQAGGTQNTSGTHDQAAGEIAEQRTRAAQAGEAQNVGNSHNLATGKIAGQHTHTAQAGEAPAKEKQAEEVQAKAAQHGEQHGATAAFVLHGVSLTAEPGQVVGVTGPVAGGKSTMGKMFLCERPYEGSIRVGESELRELTAFELSQTVGYLGHDPELLSDTVRANVCLGQDVDVREALRLVCLDGEVDAMPQGLDTLVGAGGVRLSGGQQARLALARTLARRRALYVLDDPFSAVDPTTERQIMAGLRARAQGSVIVLISHRLTTFPELDQVVWMEDGRAQVSTHAGLMQDCPAYRAFYLKQAGKVSGNDER